MPPDLLIIGASTRAAAHSALRGGLRPICVDLFGDADLRSVAEVATVDDYPAGLPAVVARLPLCPWMYTGGLENHPAIVARLAESRPLLGNSRDVLKRIRDPWWLAATLKAAGLPHLEIWPAGQTTPPRDGNWLRKPLRGAGGRGIGVWNATSPVRNEAAYFQRYSTGDSFSGLFVTRVDRSKQVQTEMLGVTRQLIGLRGISAPPFAWCGSVVPVSLPTGIVDLMRHIGERLAAAAGLGGLFGCDFIVEGDVPWLTEVNPRYTAAMELLDYQFPTSLVARHVAACTSWSEPELSPPRARHSSHPPPPLAGGPGWGGRTSLDIAGAQTISKQTASHDRLATRTRVLAKLVLFADRDLIAADATSLLTDPCARRLPLVADLPNPGQRIPVGTPVCTLFAEEQTNEACLATLLERARTFQDRFCATIEPSRGRTRTNPH
jgi:predicted ATP-grasp superfamily ATP-dependent carboligase